MKERIFILVQISRGLILKGYSAIPIYKHWWSRGKKQRTEIKLRSFIHGICDEADIDENIQILLSERLNSSGWGEKFEGWTNYEWTAPLVVSKVKDWEMSKIIDELTGEQFKKEFGIDK